MKLAVFGDVNTFQQFLLFSVMPTVFIYLWTLITGDVKNFENSKTAYSVYTAKDPINCYQNYVEQEKDS
ncbi:uncharacterized protein LOC116804960 [Drosophila grimshawi]|uniref:uncharacterized protein LOC116804960 n=1 Tax=Drosophila grimshawi TaxID=7222 RepID=UPI000C86F1D2|nr:uncharacterized protein LOC116804960 [Drosophila grimshawi]